MAQPLPKYARVDATNPEAWCQCDHCGFWRNRTDLVWQYEWGGMHLYNTEVLVCKDRCYDQPFEQLRTIILPPDPPPIVNARVPNFALEEQMVMQFQFGNSDVNPPPWGYGPMGDMMTQDQTQFLIFQYTNTQSSDPS